MVFQFVSMPCVIFLMYHGKGHFNPCFALAQILQKEYKVIFAGHAYFRNYVEEQGYTYYPLNTVPFGLGFETWVNTMAREKNIYWHSLKDRWADRLYYLREDELHGMVSVLKPEYILIDPRQSTDFIVLYNQLKSKRIKVGFINAMLSILVNKSSPPLNSIAMPDDKAGIKKAVRKFFFDRLKNIISNKIKYFGMDNEAIVKRRLKRNKIPEKYISNQSTVFGQAFKNIDEFISGPLEFELNADKKLSHQHYIGFITDHDRKELFDERYQIISSLIKKKREQSKIPLVYCSFGTVELDNIDYIKFFLKSVINIIQNKKYFCIISSGNKEIVDLQKEILDENIFFFHSVPQLAVLKDASVFITHGGLNSIKESIDAEVPMLVYPVMINTDVYGNSSRVVFHKLGLRGDIHLDNEFEIEQKITELICNSFYRNNLTSFKAQNKKYTPENFLNLFQKLKSID